MSLYNGTDYKQMAYIHDEYQVGCVDKHVKTLSYVLEEGARFFKTPRDVKNILLSLEESCKPNMDMIHGNLNRIRSYYQWEMVIEEYENLFLELAGN